MKELSIVKFIKKEKIPLIILFIVTAIVYVYQFDSKLDLNGDNIHYYHLGQNLKNGDGFTSTWEPEAPPHKHFPPGYPALIAFFSIFNQSIFFIKGMNGLLLMVSSWLLYSILRKKNISSLLALSVSLFFSLNPFLLRHATIMMSEIPFVFFLLLTLLFYQRINYRKWTDFNLILMIIFIAIGFYVKTIGISVFVGICALFLIKKQYKAFIATLSLFILLTLPWVMRNQAITSATETSYIEEFFSKNPYSPQLGYVGLGDLAARFFSNLRTYFAIEIPSFVLPFFKQTVRQNTVWGWILGIAISAAAGFGLSRLKKDEKIFYISTVSAIFGIILLWPEVWSGSRFLVPLTPFLFILFYLGMYYLLDGAFKWLGFDFQPSWLLIFLLVYIQPLINDHARSQSDYHPVYKGYFSLAEKAKETLSDSAIVVCRKPVFFYHFSGKRTIKYPFTPQTDKMIDFFNDHKITHVVIDQLGFSSTPKYLVPAIQNNEDKFKVLFQTNYPKQFLLEYLQSN